MLAISSTERERRDHLTRHAADAAREYDERATAADASRWADNEGMNANGGPRGPRVPQPQ